MAVGEAVEVFQPRTLLGLIIPRLITERTSPYCDVKTTIILISDNFLCRV